MSLQTKPAERLGYVCFIDGLRACSVLVVLIQHTRWSVAAALGAKIGGDAGVNVFFVLSGFLITTILTQERESRGAFSFAAFYGRRVLRIVPAYYVLLGVLSLALPASSRGALAVCALYLYNFALAFHWNIAGLHGPIGMTWSLCVEEHFYLVWPLALYLLGRRALIGSLVLASLSAVWRLYLAHQHVDTVTRLYMCSDTRAESLLIGCTLGLALRDPVLRERLFKMFRGPATPWLAAVGLVLCSSNMARSFNDAAISWSVFLSMHSVLVATMIVSALANMPGAFERALSGRVVVFLGKISYSLYLWHQAAFAVVDVKLATLPTSLQALLGWTLACLLATASYYVVEKPFLRLKKRFERGENPVAVRGASATSG